MNVGPDFDRKPLIEAVFELFAKADTLTQWESGSTDRAFASFPTYIHHTEKLRDVGIQVQVTSDGIVAQTPHTPRDRIRRWNESRDRAIQFGSHMCAHNVLSKAYGHFEPDLLPSVREVVRRYLDEAKPEGLAWAGQRYINEIKLPLGDQDVASYFPIYPNLPTKLMVGHRPLAIQVETVALRSGAVAVNLSLKQTDDEHATYLLDIYARSDSTLAVDADVVARWHVEAHRAIHDSFDLSVSRKCRDDIFGEKH